MNKIDYSTNNSIEKKKDIQEKYTKQDSTFSGVVNYMNDKHDDTISSELDDNKTNKYSENSNIKLQDLFTPPLPLQEEKQSNTIKGTNNTDDDKALKSDKIVFRGSPISLEDFRKYCNYKNSFIFIAYCFCYSSMGATSAILGPTIHPLSYQVCI